TATRSTSASSGCRAPPRPLRSGPPRLPPLPAPHRDLVSAAQKRLDPLEGGGARVEHADPVLLGVDRVRHQSVERREVVLGARIAASSMAAIRLSAPTAYPSPARREPFHSCLTVPSSAQDAWRRRPRCPL